MKYSTKYSITLTNNNPNHSTNIPGITENASMTQNETASLGSEYAGSILIS